jgi:nitrate/nitrite-specific signal transduction histidine kinase
MAERDQPAPEDRNRDQDQPRRPEEILNLMSKSAEFLKELMEENERLRYRAVRLQEENKELVSGMTSGRRAELLAQQIRQLENEKERILEEYRKVEDENKTYASRYINIEEENNNLANLYVCSFQLHSTLDFNEVIQIIMEIVINLIGGEDFGIYLFDEKSNLLKAVAMEGIPLETLRPIALGEGIIGKTMLSGESFFDRDLENARASQKRSPENPLVCIPLKIKEKVIGVIVLYKLLPQKTQFQNLDYELFTMLAGHAATTIFSAKLYSEAQRKLDTIKGFMGLLTTSE